MYKGNDDYYNDYQNRDPNIQQQDYEDNIDAKCWQFISPKWTFFYAIILNECNCNTY